MSHARLRLNQCVIVRLIVVIARIHFVVARLLLMRKHLVRCLIAECERHERRSRPKFGYSRLLLLLLLLLVEKHLLLLLLLLLLLMMVLLLLLIIALHALKRYRYGDRRHTVDHR